MIKMSISLDLDWNDSNEQNMQSYADAMEESIGFMLDMTKADMEIIKNIKYRISVDTEPNETPVWVSGAKKVLSDEIWERNDSKISEVEM